MQLKVLESRSVIDSTLLKLFGLLIILTCMASCGKKEEIPNTATANVVIPEDSIYIESLDRYRKLRIYLPPDYDTTDNRYPVLYMHDAQNLYDLRTAFSNEWQVDETLNRLYTEHGFSLIVVGIDHGNEHRIQEFLPWDDEEFGTGLADDYLTFVVDQVKPYVDENFRTSPEPENTGMMGSSMGALITHYATFKYPETFSRIGIFSPSYQFAEVFDFTANSEMPSKTRIYMIVGSEEGSSTVESVEDMYTTLIESTFPVRNVKKYVIEEGEHTEDLWAAEFENAVRWLYRTTY